MEQEKNPTALQTADHAALDPRAPQALSFTDIRRNTKLIQAALKEVMIEDVDWGLVPGCGDKPGLFKPGAEKLGMLFKIGYFPVIEDKSENGELRFIIRTKAIHQPTGIELGEGVGAASTLEEKYAWRRAVCDEEFEATPEERRREKWEAEWAQGRKTGKFKSLKQVRQNPANLENTIIKMAAKRSMVDVCLKVTAASDIFNQGEDDIIVDENVSRTPTKPKEKPAPASSAAANTSGEEDTTAKARVVDGVVMDSRRDGICAHCQTEIKTGASIVWHGQTKKAYHKECVA